MTEASDEFERYCKIMNVAIVVWRDVKALIDPLIYDANLNVHLFYLFINESMAKALEDNISVTAAVQDLHLRSNLESDKINAVKPDHLWMQNMFTEFDHVKLIKTETQIANHEKALSSKVERKQRRKIKQIN